MPRDLLAPSAHAPKCRQFGVLKDLRFVLDAIAAGSVTNLLETMAEANCPKAAELSCKKLQMKSHF